MGYAVANCWVSSVVQRLAAGWAIGVRGFHSRQGLGSFLFANASRPALWPTCHSVKWEPILKWPKSKADQAPPFSVQMKKACAFISTPPYGA
jgi:hypothetical protein